MNRDFVEMLFALNETGADFMIVGAHAVAAHGQPRATGDLDIWVRSTADNADRVFSALKQFGAPLANLSTKDLSHPNIVFQIGVAPSRIDVLTSITGVVFEEAWKNKIEITIEDLTVFCIGKNDLLVNKKATGRPKDLADVDSLENS
ncbi:nucleotidyltransferase [Candidatus Nitrospira salsa]